ncbi:MAG TPA: Crp/Fnr family transcriptional regulator [Bryobacteraceae bacterium]|nr:Crp/Fnr family transcriptional regulator [Bryobacteraceae bacterium]
MAFGQTAAVAPEVALEDPLAYLPCSNVLEYRKGQVIYNQTQPSSSLYLVIDGKVRVSHCSNDGKQIVVDIYQPDEFFGESVFLRLPCRAEEARALENTKLMAWTGPEVEEIASRQPRLAVALLQVMVQRNMGFTQRIESLCVENIGKRVARALLRLADRMGTPENDGSVRMLPLTHELLAQYVGTSREVVTMHMNRLRRQGYVRYSRKTIILYRDAIKEWLNRED